MNKSISILLLNILFINFHLQAQSPLNIDSLQTVDDTIQLSKEKVNNLANLYNAFLYNDSEKAYQYALEEIDVSRLIDYAEGVGMGYYHLGVYYNNTDDNDSAKYYYQLAKDQFEKINNTNRVLTVNHGLAILDYSIGNYDAAIARLRSNVEINLEKSYDTLIHDKKLNLAIARDLLGMIYLHKGDYNIALNETLRAVHLLDSLDEPIRRADAMNHLASIEFSLNNYQNSIRYNQEALIVYQQFNDKFYSAQVLNDIGNTFFYLEQYDSAIQYLEKSVELSKEINSKDIEGTALNNLGKVYKKLGDYRKSISFSEEALSIHEKTRSQNKIIESLNDLGMVYNEMGKYQDAILDFNRAIDLSLNLGIKENIRIGYYNRSLSYQRIGDYKAALEDFKKYKTIEDSIYNETKSHQIEELRTAYETEKKEKEIELQKSEIQLLEQINKVNTLQRTVLTIGVIISLVLLGLVYFGMRQKIKRRQLEKEVLNSELKFKQKELTTHALHLANKNEILEDLKLQISDLKNSDSEKNKVLNKLVNTINFNLQDDKNWENFRLYFEEVHKDFNSKIKQKFPDVTSNELRLMALMKMNLSSKEIANILNISNDGIKKARYRLRKKINISSEESLTDLIINL